MCRRNMVLAHSKFQMQTPTSTNQIRMCHGPLRSFQLPVTGNNSDQITDSQYRLVPAKHSDAQPNLHDLSISHHGKEQPRGHNRHHRTVDNKQRCEQEKQNSVQQINSSIEILDLKQERMLGVSTDCRLTFQRRSSDEEANTLTLNCLTSGTTLATTNSRGDSYYCYI